LRPAPQVHNTNPARINSHFTVHCVQTKGCVIFKHIVPVNRIDIGP
jgi:hypothetical protein